MLVTPVKTETSAVGVALGCAGLSDQDRVRWNASQASAAMVAPRAVEQRRRNVNGQLRPSGSEFEWSRWSDRSDESTHQGVALGWARRPRIARPATRATAPKASVEAVSICSGVPWSSEEVPSATEDIIIVADRNTLLPERALV